MARFLRFVLPLLLAVTLPLQGYAAATMRFCGPGHPGAPMPMQAPANEHGKHAADGAAHEAADAQSHHGSPSGDEPETPGKSAQQDASQSPMTKVAKGTCSLCAACSA